MGHQFVIYLILVLVILGLNVLAKKLKIAYPVVLVLGGLLISFIPGIPQIVIDPELIFVIFLPPLLYEAAWYTSWKDFWRWRRVIGSFAFLIVLVTSFVVALVSNAFIPGITLALGFLLGGIVSPPDAVSAMAILKNIKVPKRVIAIIEGESLLNDASSLVVFRFALIAVGTGNFVFHEAAISFVWVIAAGIGIGLAIGYIFQKITQWVSSDANTDIVLTLLGPYVMYISAEALHVSGVLAVVTGGLFLSNRAHLFLSHRSRLQGANVWSAVTFVLNGLVFMLIGLELPVIVQGLDGVSLSSAIWYGVLITVVLMVLRMLCTLGASAFTVFISRYITTADSRPGVKGPIILGWAGMRGVVSLAAALSIPPTLGNGQPFPQRNLLLFITFVVILLTLVIQGITLPWVVRAVDLEDPDHAKPDHEQDELIREKLARKSIEYVQQHHGELIATNDSLRYLTEKWSSEPQLASGGDQLENFKRVYLAVLEQQRQWLMEMNKNLEISEEVIRKHQSMIDMEEEKMNLRYE